MGWFDDVIGAVTNPIGYAGNQLAGDNGKKWATLADPFGAVQEKVAGAITGTGQESPFAPGAIPDYTDQWTKISQDLNGQKLQDANNNLQSAAAGSLANATGNLAMRGGLSAGANERLADANMNGFQDAYSNLATKFGLGSSEIAKQGLETKQDMELKKAESGDRVAAARAGAKNGGLLGMLGLG